MKFSAKRITRSYTQLISATPEKIFPLLCPERETEWLDEWTYKMIYSKSGLAEIDAIFTTSSKGEEDTIWIVTVHDPVLYKIEFVRVTPESRASVLQIQIREKDEKSSYVDIKYIYTGLNQHGNDFIDNYTEDVFLEMVKHWEDSVNYYLATGKKLLKNR